MNNPNEAGERRQWLSHTMACGTVRHRLYVNGAETPYFVDKASRIAHFTCGHSVGLYGSGMGSEIRRRDGSTYQIAAILGAFDNVRDAKAKAEAA